MLCRYQRYPDTKACTDQDDLRWAYEQSIAPPLFASVHNPGLQVDTAEIILFLEVPQTVTPVPR